MGSGERAVSEQEKKLKNDILLIVFLAVSVLILLSNFGLCGAVGRYVSRFLFGLFGFIAYIVPVILFFAAAFFIANKDIPHIRLKAVGACGLFISIVSFLQLLMIGYEEDARILSYFTYSSEDHLGGGLIGGIIVTLLGKLIGTTGAYIVIIAAMIVFAILMTQRPLVTDARRRSSIAVQNARTRHTEKTVRRRERTSSGGVGDYDLKKERELEGMDEPVLPVIEAEENDFTDTEPEPPRKKTRSRRSSGTQKGSDTAAADTKDIAAEIEASATAGTSEYRFPPLSFLKQGGKGSSAGMSSQIRATALKLQETLNNFGVKATVVNVSSGPTVTRYELQPEQGVKVSRIVALSDDIKLNLAAEDIRIEAPIPGKAAVGIEVPNKTNASVFLGDLLKTEEFTGFRSKLAFAVGKDLAGKTVVTDIAKMPHLLIAGATGSGKSVCINSLILSILYKATPEEVRFIMIDPKVVELSVFNNIPHLYIPVVTDPKKASGALNWAVSEMTNRYNKFAEFGVRDIKGYNEKVSRIASAANEEEEPPKKLPQIVIIIDELADLMMVAPGEIEDAIVRLTQLARAAGIHLIVATQRPSVNVITGLIKANMPSRIALSVASGIDSRVIIDMNGAEKLLGKGDMLFYPQGYQKPARVQGAFVSDEEIEKVVRFLIDQKGEVEYDSSIQESIDNHVSGGSSGEKPSDERDVYFIEAGKFIIEKDKASIGMLQRIFKIGFNRAARIMDQLADAGVVGPEEGTKPRKILMTMEQFENYLEEN